MGDMCSLDSVDPVTAMLVFIQIVSVEDNVSAFGFSE